MANTDRETVSVDPFFFIPEGMKGWHYKDSEESDELDYVEDSTTDVESDVTIVDDGITPSDDTLLAVPDSMTVISQTIRRLPDGSQVVDVVVEVPDVPAAIKYEVRVTKVS